MWAWAETASLPTCFLSFSDQILLIAVNRHFSWADGFQRPCQEDGFSLSLLPAPPVLEFPVAEAVNSHIVQRTEAKMETRRRGPRQVSCGAAARDPRVDRMPQRCGCRSGGRHPRRRLPEQPPGDLSTLNRHRPRARGKRFRTKSRVNTGAVAGQACFQQRIPQSPVLQRILLSRFHENFLTLDF